MNKNFQFRITSGKLIFALAFAFLGFITLQVPINTLEGSRVKFTLFDLFAPISGAFVGTPLGVISVLSANLVNLLLNGFSNIEKGSIIRLFPTLFAVWFFVSCSARSKQVLTFNKLILAVPVISILLFNLHPVGRSVWFYSLFWVIPLVTYPFKERFLVLRALGSTFTAHAVGGAIWIWAFNLPANVWVSLIPVVILERAIFALGISASYILTNNILALIAKNKFAAKVISFDKKYLFPLVK